MRKLLQKELLLNKRILAITGLLVFGWTAYMSSQDIPAHQYFIFNAIGITLALALIPVTREDQCKGPALACSLPVKRKTVISSRYAFAWLVMAAGMLATIALAALLPFSRIAIQASTIVPVLLPAIGLGAWLVAFSFPFTIRFGRFGLILLLVVFQFLGVVLILLAALLNIRFRLSNFFAWIALSSPWLQRQLSVPARVALLLLLAVSLNWASLKISQSLYRRKEI